MTGYGPSSTTCRRLCTAVGPLYLTRFAAHCGRPTPRDNFYILSDCGQSDAATTLS